MRNSNPQLTVFARHLNVVAELISYGVHCAKTDQSFWWACPDLNRKPSDYESLAANQLSYRPDGIIP